MMLFPGCEHTAGRNCVLPPVGKALVPVPTAATEEMKVKGMDVAPSPRRGYGKGPGQAVGLLSDWFS